MNRIDFRSDIISNPTPAMMQAMTEAALQPRGFGFREDEDVRELESISAHILGMEDALFFPTCTMANQVALMLHCRPGTFVTAERMSHVVTVEAASTAGVAGVAVRTFEGTKGHPTPAQIESILLAAQRPGQAPSSLVWLENTHNQAGGTVMPRDAFHNIVDIARRHGVPVHVDGSRLWNAVAHHAVSPADIVSGADTVAVSLNKALSAPTGAMLVGSRATIGRALTVRNMLGGGWRPAGILAAAGVVALNTRRERIVEDHRRAALLAKGLAALEWLELNDPETNIVVVGLGAFEGTVADLVGRLAQEGVLVNAQGERAMRLVLHAGIDDAAVDAAIEVFGRVRMSLAL